MRGWPDLAYDPRAGAFVRGRSPVGKSRLAQWQQRGLSLTSRQWSPCAQWFDQTEDLVYRGTPGRSKTQLSKTKVTFRTKTKVTIRTKRRQKVTLFNDKNDICGKNIWFYVNFNWIYMAILDLLHVKYSDNNFKDKFILIVMQFKLVLLHMFWYCLCVRPYQQPGVCCLVGDSVTFL